MVIFWQMNWMQAGLRQQLSTRCFMITRFQKRRLNSHMIGRNIHTQQTKNEWNWDRHLFFISLVKFEKIVCSTRQTLAICIQAISFVPLHHGSLGPAGKHRSGEAGQKGAERWQKLQQKWLRRHARARETNLEDYCYNCSFLKINNNMNHSHCLVHRHPVVWLYFFFRLWIIPINALQHISTGKICCLFAALTC